MWEKLYCQEMEYIKRSNKAKQELYRTLKRIQTHNEWWLFEFLELLKNSFNHFISYFLRHISKHIEIVFYSPLFFPSSSHLPLSFPSPLPPPFLPFFLPSFHCFYYSSFLLFLPAKEKKHDSFKKYYSKGKMLLYK